MQAQACDACQALALPKHASEQLCSACMHRRAGRPATGTCVDWSDSEDESRPPSSDKSYATDESEAEEETTEECERSEDADEAEWDSEEEDTEEEENE